MFWHQFISRKPVELGRYPECFPVLHSCKPYQEKSTALPFALRGSSASLRFSPPCSPEFTPKPVEIRIYPFSFQASPESPIQFAAIPGHTPLKGVTISRCQQPPVPPMSPAAGGSCPHWAQGGFILTGTQATAMKSHGEIPFPCDFYAGEHSAFLGSIWSCCLCQEFYSQCQCLGLR